MKSHLASALLMSLAVVSGLTSEARAGGLPYYMTGTLEEQAYRAMQYGMTMASSGALILNGGYWWTTSGTTTIAAGTLTISNSLVPINPQVSLTAGTGPNATSTFLTYPYVFLNGWFSTEADGTVLLRSWQAGRTIGGIATSPSIFPPEEVGAWVTPLSANASRQYNVSVGNATDSITVTPQLSPGTGSTRVLVAGVEVAEGTSSAALPLQAGVNDIRVEIQWLQNRQPVTLGNGSYVNNGPPLPVEYVTASSFVLHITRLVNELPEIGVRAETSATVDLPPGATVDVGRAGIGETATKSFTVVSSGTGRLTGVNVTIDGANASDFRVVQQPAATVARLNGSTTFRLGFTPAASGVKNAVAHVWSNDADESPFDIALTGRSGSQANLTMSLPGNHLQAGTNVFRWDAGAGATRFVLWFGSAPGRYDRGIGTFDSNTTSTTITSPGDGQPVYVTLWSLVNGVWQSSSDVFTDYAKTKARITSPANGSTLTTTQPLFQWDAGLGVTKYALWLGTSAGGHDIAAVDTGNFTGSSLQVPATGRQVHATLFSMINGAWQSNSYVFTAAQPVRSSIDGTGTGGGGAGAPSHVLDDGRLSLQWDNGVGVTKRAVWIGSTPGGYDLGAVDVTGRNSDLFNLPTDGGPVYVTMWSFVNGAWQSDQSAFNARQPSSAQTPRPAQLTSPSNSSKLNSNSVDLTWEAGVGVSQYALWVGSQPDGYDLLAANESAGARSHHLSLPGDGRRVYVTLHSLISGRWNSFSYYFDSSNTPSPGATITAPAAGSTLADNTLTVTWNTATDATRYALWVGSWPGSWDVYAGDEGTNLTRTITTAPVDGRPLYVTLYSLISSKWVPSTLILNAATTAGATKQKARILTPANGSTLTAADTTFTWDAGMGATAYVLWIGNSCGAYDQLASQASTDLTRTVTLPTDGRKVYATLWSQIDGQWKANYYQFTTVNIAPVKAEMISPPAGSTFASASQTFTWSAGTKVSMYALWIGRQPGGYDIHASLSTGTLNKTVTNLPADGSPIYVRLFSLINGAWQSSDYIYNAFTVQ